MRNYQHYWRKLKKKLQRNPHKKSVSIERYPLFYEGDALYNNKTCIVCDKVLPSERGRKIHEARVHKVEHEK